MTTTTQTNESGVFKRAASSSRRSRATTKRLARVSSGRTRSNSTRLVSYLVKKEEGNHTRVLERRMSDINGQLDELTNNWIDALDNWQTALRDGANHDAQEWARLHNLETQMLNQIERQKRIGEALHNALENTNP